MKQFTIPTNRGNKLVFEGDIIRVEACSNYCKVFFRNERPLVVAKVLHWFQEHLPAESFCRIHRTHLVNKLYVIDILQHSKLRLSNGELLQISRRRKTEAGQLLRQIA